LQRRELLCYSTITTVIVALWCHRCNYSSAATPSLQH
jgi:hypothetical protein